MNSIYSSCYGINIKDNRVFLDLFDTGVTIVNILIMFYVKDLFIRLY